MKDLLCDQFQETVNETLIRHKSILDILSKLQEANARVNRAVSKAVTSCGCVKVAAEKQHIPVDPDMSLQQLKDFMGTHLEGELCEHCEEIIDAELGNNLFYVAALCNALDLNLYDILLKEQKRMATLGVYRFS